MKDIERIARQKLSNFDNTHYRLLTAKEREYIETRVVKETNREYHKSIFVSLNICVALFVIMFISCLIVVATGASNVYYFPVNWIAVAECALFLIILLILYSFINLSLKKITKDRIGHLFKK